MPRPRPRPGWGQNPEPYKDPRTLRCSCRQEKLAIYRVGDLIPTLVCTWCDRTDLMPDALR